MFQFKTGELIFVQLWGREKGGGGQNLFSISNFFGEGEFDTSNFFYGWLVGVIKETVRGPSLDKNKSETAHIESGGGLPLRKDFKATCLKLFLKFYIAGNF